MTDWEEREIAAQVQERKLNELIREYAEWNAGQGLSLGSADEHVFDENLTADQRQWLRGFCDRWQDVTSPAL